MKAVWKLKFVFYPALIFAAYFAVDKFCLGQTYKLYSQGDATYLFYDYKPVLMDEMEIVYKRMRGETPPADVVARFQASKPVDPPDAATFLMFAGALPADPGGDIDPGEPNFPATVRPKLLMVLGTSRMLYFDYPRFDRNFPEWEMFNFSAPVTMPAYYLYVLERALERGVKPDYILLEADPFQFNESSDAFARSNLGYTFDFKFILQHFNLFTRDEVSLWIGRNLFAGFKYPPDPGNIYSRLRNPQSAFMAAIPLLDRYQRLNRGAGKNIIPLDQWFERDFATLGHSAERSLRWLYSGYKISERQFEFLDETARLAREHGIPVVMIRPQVSRPLARRMAQDETLQPALAEYERRIQEIATRRGAKYIDLGRNPDYYCNSYVDASHMATDCYQPMLLLAMREYWRREAAAISR